MEEEHKIFMQEYEKYGNNCMQIAKVLNTRTPAQIKKHAECFFKQNLKTNSAAVKRYQEPLSPDKKSTSFGRKSSWTTKLLTVSITRKKQILCNNADAHKKQRESLPPEKKVKILQIMLTHIKKNKSLFLLKTKTYL